MSEMNKSVGERIAEIRRQLASLNFDDETIQQMRDKLAAHPELSKAFGEAYGKYLNNESIRPTLGNEMQIFYMRERQTLTFLLFPELLKLEYEVSRMIGELVMADQMGGYTLPEIMKNNAPLAVRDKYAIEEVVEADDKHAIYRHYECADCYGVPNIGMKICAYEAGTAAGCFGAAMGKRCEVVETKCCANGDPYCEFLVTVVED
jgi:predicted hydrocarbon binding protein